MGLDITAYSKVRLTDIPADSEAAREGKHFTAYPNRNFPGRADDIEGGKVYAYDKAHAFRAGSYGGYNAWREELANLAGYPLGSYDSFGVSRPSRAAALWNGEVTEGPFYEMINFSDCEGVIGAAVAAKLAKDFADFDEKAKGLGEVFYDRYKQWRMGFELAADGGCVSFH